MPNCIMSTEMLFVRWQPYSIVGEATFTGSVPEKPFHHNQIAMASEV